MSAAEQGAQTPAPGTRHYERFTMECEAYVVHRDDCFVKAQGDPAGLPWRACVRTGDGTLHWEWCRTERQAFGWIERWKRAVDVTADIPVKQPRKQRFIRVPVELLAALDTRLPDLLRLSVVHDCHSDRHKLRETYNVGKQITELLKQ